MSGWVFLAFSIALELAGTTCMKMSQGFTRPVPSVLLFVFYGLCFGSFTIAIKTIELSTAYAIWAGMGTVLIAGIGVYWFDESVTPIKLVCIALIVAGVVGLNVTSKGLHDPSDEPPGRKPLPAAGGAAS